jgi:hypothetical protein
MLDLHEGSHAQDIHHQALSIDAEQLDSQAIANTFLSIL